MIPASFEYLRPATVDEALGLLAKHGDAAKILAGGHSLIPAMKLRLAQPTVLVDIGRIGELSYIRRNGGHVAIGPLTTHHEIESSDVLHKACPLLPTVAATIGDVQVRNRGTIGGSLVHADPAADWPAAILALEAEIEIAGPSGRRTVQATDFFVDVLQTAVSPNEIVCEIRVPKTAASVAYLKIAQKASGFALAGVAAIVGRGGTRVGITGVAPTPYRAAAVEHALARRALDAKTIDAAAARAADGVDPLSDIHASAEFRAHLATVLTRRALLEAAAAR